MTKHILFSLALAIPASAMPIHGIGCAATAESAVAHMLANTVSTNTTAGFRVDAIRIDRIQNRQWAMVASCSEPAKPRIAFLLPANETIASEMQQQAAAIHTGDAVTILSSNPDSTMQLLGSAIETGAVGDRIHVRLQNVAARHRLIRQRHRMPHPQAWHRGDRAMNNTIRSIHNNAPYPANKHFVLFSLATAALLLLAGMMATMHASDPEETPAHIEARPRDELTERLPCTRPRRHTRNPPRTRLHLVRKRPLSRASAPMSAPCAPHDLISVVVNENLSATTDGTVKNSRASNASSGIFGLLGTLHAGNAMQNLITQNSTAGLNASGDSETSSSLNTTLGGQVVEVLPNGMLVIEAARQVEFNQQTQTIILRGLVRPEDISQQNQVLSTSISSLELEVKGKGIINDYTHRQNALVRLIQKLLVF